MSLRQKLLERSKVAGCVHQQTQLRNFSEISATANATAAQLSSANPHKYWVLSATANATEPQLGSCAGAGKHPPKVALVAPVAESFDDRVVCLTCRHRTGNWSCRNWRAAGLSSAQVGPHLQRLPQRCPAHRPAAAQKPPCFAEVASVAVASAAIQGTHFVAPLTGDFGESEGERNDLWPRLKAAAERCGDHWGDSPERRAEMLESLRSMPVGWQWGWLEHLEASYGLMKPR